MYNLSKENVAKKNCLKKIISIDELLYLLDNNTSVYIYGAGKKAINILEEIEYNGQLNKIKGIFVTGKDSASKLYGIQIKGFAPDLIDPSVNIIIAVPNIFLSEIVDNLINSVSCNIFSIGNELESELGEKKRIRAWEKYEQQLKKIIETKRDTDINITFFSLPYWDVYSPFSAVPCLVGYLRDKGIKVEQFDLGIMCIHNLFNTRAKNVIPRIKERSFYEECIEKSGHDRYISYEEYINSLWFFKDGSFLFEEVKKKYDELNTMQKSALDGFYRRVYDLCASDIDFDNCINIDDAVSRYDANNFFATMAQGEVKEALAALPDIVGMSVTSTHQFIPAIILSGLIKKYRPEIKTIFGGSCVDLFFQSDYPHKEDIKKYFDFCCNGEGETCLYRLLCYLHGDDKIELNKIPNLVFVDDEGNFSYSVQYTENVDELPAPDFSGLNLSLYLAPKLILPYQTSRGCHYGHCAFCNHNEKYRHNYRSKKMNTVVHELLALSRKYETRYFQFVDEAIRPDCFKEMIEIMDECVEFKKIRWFYYSRVSMEYKQDLLIKAKRNGCEMVMFGIETLNQRLLNFISKGINANTSKYCMDLFRKCGIKVYIWLMCNLPSETLNEVYEDYEQVKKLRGTVNAMSVGLFMLQKNTDMYANPGKFNILEIDKNDPRKFVSHNGGNIIDKNEMLEFFKRNYAILAKKWSFSNNRYVLFFDSVTDNL